MKNLNKWLLNLKSRKFFAKEQKKPIKKTFKHKGFTLFEVMVSMVISGMVMASAMGTYWVLVQSHHKNALYREMLRQTMFAMTKMTDQVRNYGIDYDAYASGSACDAVGYKNGQTVSGNMILCLGGDIVFEGEKTEDLSPKTIPAKYFYKLNIKKTVSGITTISPLFSDNFEVESLKFSFTPEKEPNKTGYEKEYQLQPKVNISMKVRSSLDHNVNFSLQTTVSARNYKF
jgi:prepilin-type N-terminal cleavage/methylation domain-containing protein